MAGVTTPGISPARLVILSGLLLASLAAAALATPPSTYREEVLAPDGPRYTVAVPAAYEKTKPVPLVLALHFGGEVTPYLGRRFLETLVEPALRKLGAIVVAPDCRRGTWASEASEADVLAVLEQVRKDYATDPERTLVTGYSMGGIGTWALAARHPELFRAGVVVSGAVPRGAPSVEWKVPLYVIHSRDDEVIPLKATVELVDEVRKAGAPVKLVVVEGVTHYQVGGFVPYLRASVPWIEKTWKQAQKR